MSTLSAGLHSAADSGALPAALRDVVDFQSLPRTYANALRLCALLPTNRDVTSLFDVADGADLNAVALPEVEAWLARAGYADLGRDLAPLRCVHVSGTKGKGSVCAFVTAVLVGEAAAAAGRVGTYLSPHAVSPRERIWLDGRPIAPGLFARYVFELWERLSAADPDAADGYNPYNTAANKPFYFRFLTLLALHVFLAEGVRSAVIECGIGGAYDATNVLPPGVVTATAVTRLDVDHVAMLGRTLPEIAWHKAGIFKKGVAAFTVAAEEEEGGVGDAAAALAVLRDQARARGARALHDIPARLVARWDGVPDAALPGPFQRYNMALAAAVAQEHLRVVSGGGADGADDSVPDLDPAHMPARFRAAMAGATLRARCETVADRHAPGPGTAAAAAEWLVDGAHTVDSLGAVAAFFASREAASTTSSPPRRILLFGVVGRNLGDLARVVVTTASSAVPAAPFDRVLLVLPSQDTGEREAAIDAVKKADPHAAVQLCDDVEAAVQAARTLAEQAGKTDAATATPPCRVLVTGSFVLAGKVLRQLGYDGEDE